MGYTVVGSPTAVGNPAAMGSPTAVGGGPGAAGYNPATDANLVAWYRENVTDTGSDGTADEWIDKTGNGFTGVLVGAAVAAPINASDADFNGNQSLSFETGGDINPFHVESSSPSDWRFLHDGTGCYGAVAFRSNSTDTLQPLFATCDRNNNNTGLLLRYDGTNERVEFILADGSGLFNVIVASSNNSALPNVTYWLTFRHKSGETNEWEVYLDGSLLISGDYGAAPASGDPTDVLTLAAEVPIFSNRFSGKQAEQFFGQGYPDMTDINVYGTTRYGL